MSNQLTDDALALTFAQALRARGWTVTPPEGVVMPPPPPPEPEPPAKIEVPAGPMAQRRQWLLEQGVPEDVLVPKEQAELLDRAEAAMTAPGGWRSEDFLNWRPTPKPPLTAAEVQAMQSAQDYMNAYLRAPRHSQLLGGPTLPPITKTARLYAQTDVPYREIREAGGRNFLSASFHQGVRQNLLRALADALDKDGVVTFEPAVSDNIREVDSYRAHLDVVVP